MLRRTFLAAPLAGCALPGASATGASPTPVLHHHKLAFDAGGTGWTFSGSHDETPLAPANMWRLEDLRWRVAAASGPAPRATYVLEATDAGMLMFGGWTPDASLGDTWLWRDGAWREVRPQQSPSPRNSAAFARDPQRNRLVLFGGGGDGVGETWEWDRATWSRAQTVDHPSPRQRACMAHDPIGGGVILFGGFANPTALDDTWRWDGRTWTRLDVRGPPGRANHAMATDPARGVVLYGGWRPNPHTVLGDAWLWDGASWRELQEPAPPARDTAAMAWSPAEHALVLHGGRNAAGVGLSELWTWDGAWRQR